MKSVWPVRMGGLHQQIYLFDCVMSLCVELQRVRTYVPSFAIHRIVSQRDQHQFQIVQGALRKLDLVLRRANQIGIGGHN